MVVSRTLFKASLCYSFKRMGRGRFKKRGIKVFILCVIAIFGLNRLIQPKHLSKIENLERRLKGDSNNVSIILSIADTYYKKAIHLSSSNYSIPYLENAISLYKRAFEIEKKPKIAFYLGRAYFNLAKYAKKKDEFYELSQKNFLFAYSNGFVSLELFILLGHTYLVGGNLEKAIEFYKKGLAISKGDPTVLLNLGFCYKEKGELDKALQYLKMIDEPKEKELSKELHLQLGEIYEKMGFSLLSTKEYLLVLEKDKKNKEAQRAIKRLD